MGRSTFEHATGQADRAPRAGALPLARAFPAPSERAAAARPGAVSAHDFGAVAVLPRRRATVQRHAIAAGHGAAIQRATLGSFNDGVRVDDTTYDNSNWAAIRTHMAGEWDGGNESKPSGGHLLSSMVATWGAATYGTANNRNLQATDRSGVYFTGANNLPTKPAADQHDYFLVQANGQKKQSKTKSSSFWPRGWSRADLKATLDNSYTTNQGNVYASKENTTYWYTWQTLGDDNKTVFPKKRYPTGFS